VECKYVLVDDASRTALRWQEGDNMSVAVPDSLDGAPVAALDVTIPWCKSSARVQPKPASLAEALKRPEAATAAAAARVPGAALRAARALQAASEPAAPQPQHTDEQDVAAPAPAASLAATMALAAASVVLGSAVSGTMSMGSGSGGAASLAGGAATELSAPPLPSTPAASPAPALTGPADAPPLTQLVSAPVAPTPTPTPMPSPAPASAATPSFTLTPASAGSPMSLTLPGVRPASPALTITLSSSASRLMEVAANPRPYASVFQPVPPTAGAGPGSEAGLRSHPLSEPRAPKQLRQVKVSASTFSAGGSGSRAGASAASGFGAAAAAGAGEVGLYGFDLCGRSPSPAMHSPWDLPELSEFSGPVGPEPASCLPRPGAAPPPSVLTRGGDPLESCAAAAHGESPASPQPAAETDAPAPASAASPWATRSTSSGRVLFSLDAATPAAAAAPSAAGKAARAAAGPEAQAEAPGLPVWEAELGAPTSPEAMAALLTQV
jgi:hypothetical protein